MNRIRPGGRALWRYSVLSFFFVSTLIFSDHLFFSFFPFFLATRAVVIRLGSLSLIFKILQYLLFTSDPILSFLLGCRELLGGGLRLGLGAGG